MIFILPIENYAREFDYKFLLASFLTAKFSVPSVIAISDFAHSLALQYRDNAIYIGKNIYEAFSTLSTNGFTSYSYSHHKALALLNAGCKIIFTEEEGGTYLAADGSVDDIQYYKSRFPFFDFPTEFSQSIHFHHWGPYQHELATTLLPSFTHIVSGCPQIDAAHLYREFYKPADIHPFHGLLGLTSNSAILSHSAFLNSPFYISLCSILKQHGSKRFIDGILSQVSLFDLALQLYDSGYSFVYRPHPGSLGPHEFQWEVFCKSRNLPYSKPSHTTALTYLSSISLNIHTGCTTGFLSYALGSPSIRYREYCYGPSPLLLTEHSFNSLPEFKLLKPPYPLPAPGPYAENILCNLRLNVSCQSFVSIAHSVSSFLASNYSRSNLSVRSRLADSIYSSLRSVYKKASLSRQISKFSHFNPDDIARNSQIFRLWQPSLPLPHVTGSSSFLYLR